MSVRRFWEQLEAFKFLPYSGREKKWPSEKGGFWQWFDSETGLL